MSLHLLKAFKCVRIKPIPFLQPVKPYIRSPCFLFSFLALPEFPRLQPTGLLSVAGTHQAYFYLRAFALALPPPRTLSLSPDFFMDGFSSHSDLNSITGFSDDLFSQLPSHTHTSYNFLLYYFLNILCILHYYYKLTCLFSYSFVYSEENINSPIEYKL